MEIFELANCIFLVRFILYFDCDQPLSGKK